MNDTVYPWRLIPNKRHNYPGGREIDLFRGIVPGIDDGHPEAWVGSTTNCFRPSFPMDGHSECIRPSGGKCYLSDAIKENPQAMLGTADKLAVLVKLLDAAEQLCFQCHPSREVAKRLFNSDFGKTEAWVIIGLRKDVAEPPYVLLGFKPGITREKFEALYNAGDIPAIDALAHKIPVCVGDTFFVGPGVPHAIGAGCFLVEVQEPSDITVGTWIPSNLSQQQKKLHDERVLDSFDFTGYSYSENLARCRCNPQVIRSGDWGMEELLVGSDQTTYFSCTRLQAARPVAWRKTGRAVICIVLSGSGKLVHGSSSTLLNKADELFMPADACAAMIHPGPDGLCMVLCHPEGAGHGTDEQKVLNV